MGVDGEGVGGVYAVIGVSFGMIFLFLLQLVRDCIYDTPSVYIIRLGSGA